MFKQKSNRMVNGERGMTDMQMCQIRLCKWTVHVLTMPAIIALVYGIVFYFLE